MKKLYFFFLSLFLQSLIITTAAGQSPQSLTDSTAFQDFLIKQKEIQGLSVRFLIEKSDFTDSIPGDSIFRFAETSPGLLSSVEITQLGNFPKLLDTLSALDPTWEFLIFSQPSTFIATQEYVANLIRNGDIQELSKEIAPDKDLVLLASNFQYVPFFKYKLPFSSDYKLFIVVAIIAFFLISASVMILFMVIFKAKKNKKEQLMKDYEPLIAEALTAILFEKEIDEIKGLSEAEVLAIFPAGLLSRPLFQSVLIEKIIGLNKKMKGDFKDKLKALYQKLGLDKVSMANLHGKRWDKVATGLVQINEMDLIEALPEVKKHANSPNFHVRTQAIGTLLNLSEKMDLTFLKDQNYPLSSWQQMNYLRIIKFLYPQKELQMLSLFDSENQSVRLFGYKLVRLIGRVDLLENLEKSAINAPDDEKIEIIKTYADLGAYMQADFLNRCLLSENPKLQQAAAQAIGVIGNNESVPIIENLLKSQPDFPMKMILLKSLQKLDSNQFEKFTGIQTDIDTQRIKRHLLDPLLNHV